MAPTSLARIRLAPCLSDPRALVLAGVMLGLLGCTDRRQEIPVVVTDGSIGDGGARNDGLPDGVDAPPDVPIFTLDAAGDRPPCTPVVCQGPTYKYCGMIGDGCGLIVNCGGCPGTQVCGSVTRGVCGGGPGCTPATCDSPGGRFCGTVGDGCGGVLTCGACTKPGETCGGSGTPGLCGGGACTPVTCMSAGVRYCGSIGDGCGKTLACGDCPTGETCGGTGRTPNVCAKTMCTPLTCTTATGQYCGKIGNGCGGTLDCPACPAGQVCGGAGSAGVCTPSACTPVTCQQATGKYCGMIGDGCGKTIDCGGCPGNDSCGGGGLANICGNLTGQCTNLCLRQMACAGGAKTTITGTVLTPTRPEFGAPDPIYNALVYVPNAPVAAFPPGVACEKCGAASGSPLVWVNSGPDGKFTLENVPTGANVPLVIQVGRWRRQIVIPNVAPCTNTVLTAEQTRMPRNKSEGDIPLMAFTTGGADPLECLLRKVGIDDSEFTLPTGNGRVHMYRGPGWQHRVRARPGRRRFPQRHHLVGLGREPGQVRRGPARLRGPIRRHVRLSRQQVGGGPAEHAGLRQQGRPRVRRALAQRLAAPGSRSPGP